MCIKKTPTSCYLSICVYVLLVAVVVDDAEEDLCLLMASKSSVASSLRPTRRAKVVKGLTGAGVAPATAAASLPPFPTATNWTDFSLGLSTFISVKSAAFRRRCLPPWSRITSLHLPSLPWFNFTCPTPLSCQVPSTKANNLARTL